LNKPTNLKDPDVLLIFKQYKYKTNQTNKHWNIYWKHYIQRTMPSTAGKCYAPHQCYTSMATREIIESLHIARSDQTNEK